MDSIADSLLRFDVDNDVAAIDSVRDQQSRLRIATVLVDNSVPIEWFEGCTANGWSVAFDLNGVMRTCCGRLINGEDR